MSNSIRKKVEGLKKESFFVKVWNVLWPLMIYTAAQVVATVAGMLILMLVGSIRYADENGQVRMAAVSEGALEMFEGSAILCLLAAALVCIPVYYRMYQKDFERSGEVKRNVPFEGKDLAALVICGATLAVAMNCLISITPLPQIFTGYEDTNEVIFGGSLVFQVITAGVFGCIVEELSMRGIVYHRMKRYWGKRRAIVWSAVVFGAYHMNVVQGVYAFALGLFMAWVCERYDNLWASVVVHMSANLCVIFLGMSEAVEKVLNTLVGYCLVTCICFLVFYYGWRWMKQTDPFVELEFVSKEPDSLETLTQEYKEQERKEE